MDMSDPRVSLFAALRGLHHRARTVQTSEELDAFLDDAAEFLDHRLGWRGVVFNVHRRAFNDFSVAQLRVSPEAAHTLVGTSQTWEQWLPLMDARFARNGTYYVPIEEMPLVDPLPPTYVASGPAARTAPEAWHQGDQLFVPMLGADEVVNGILAVDAPASGLVPSEEELDALAAVANVTGLAIEHRRTALRDAEHRRALAELLRVSARLTDARSTEAVLDAVSTGIRDALGFLKVAVLLRHVDAIEPVVLRPAAAAGWKLDDPELQLSLPIPVIDAMLIPKYEEHGCFLLPQDIGIEITGFQGAYASQRNGRGPWAWSRHWLIVPLRDPDNVLVGAIWVEDPVDYLLPDTDRLQALRLFADQAEAALAAARSYEATLHAAEHDGLTGLPNRRTMVERLGQAIARGERQGHAIATLFVDLDRFKAINDTYGHEAGDEVLRTVSRRIASLVRPGDTVARLGGDEFVVVCEDIGGPDDALDVAQRLRTAVAKPIDLGSNSVSVTACVGVALPSDAEDARTLLRDADLAMYRAKQAGRDTVQLADVALRAGASARARLQRALDGATERGEIELHWQPIVDLDRRVSPAPRASCAGTTRRWAACHRWSSSRWPRRPARSCRSEPPGSSTAPASRPRSGAPSSATPPRVSPSTSHRASCGLRRCCATSPPRWSATTSPPMR